MRKAFEGIFGNTAELRILEFLLPLEGLSFNLSELAEEAEVSRPTVQKVVEKFVKHGILKTSRTQGNTTFYEIDTASPFVTLFEEINNVLIEEMLDENTLNEIRIHWESMIPRPKQRPTVVGAMPELDEFSGGELDVVPKIDFSGEDKNFPELYKYRGDMSGAA